MICPNCNHPLPEDSKFCVYCGSKLKAGLSSVNETISGCADVPSSKSHRKCHRSFPVSTGILLFLTLILVGSNIFLHSYGRQQEAMLPALQDEIKKSDDAIHISQYWINEYQNKVQIYKLLYDSDIQPRLDLYYGKVAIIAHANSSTYHLIYSCTDIYGSKSPLIMSVEEAEKRGYTRCTLCHHGNWEKIFS